MNQMYYKVGLGVIAASVLFSVGFLVAQRGVLPSKNQEFVVTATIFPLAEAARAIALDPSVVVTLIPPGVEAHDYSPSVRSLAEATQSDVFISVGGGFDSWAFEAATAVNEQGGVAIEAVQFIDLLEVAEGGHDDHVDDGDHGEDHDHGAYDPHFWLDPVRMMVLLPKIEQAFILADPENAERYSANAAAYMEELLALHTAYEDRLVVCESREIVVTHDAYSYLASRYDLSTHAILGLSPEDEPSVGELADLTQFIQDEGVTTLFFEETAGQSLAQMLVDEVGVTPAVLSPLENVTVEQSASRETYTSIMFKNLEALSKALICQ